jgi:hypothetical protein
MLPLPPLVIFPGFCFWIHFLVRVLLQIENHIPDLDPDVSVVMDFLS